MIAADPKSAEIIRPILRGRDIKRYNYEFADLYIIATFPSLKINIEKYPAIKQHLLSYGYERLKQTGEVGARKKTNNQWFETQDSISYWDDFYKQKIVYPDIMRMPRQKEALEGYPYFYLDESNFYVEATNFLITGRDIDLIYLFLTSDVGFFAFTKFYLGPQFDATGFRYKKAYIEDAFVPIISSEVATILRTFISYITRNREEVESIWSQAIGLNNDEIDFIKQYKENLLSNA